MDTQVRVLLQKGVTPRRPLDKVTSGTYIRFGIDLIYSPPDL